MPTIFPNSKAKKERFISWRMEEWLKKSNGQKISAFSEGYEFSDRLQPSHKFLPKNHNGFPPQISSDGLKFNEEKIR